MLSNEWEGKLQNRFILVIDGIDSFLIESATKPNLTYDEIIIPYINNIRFMAGRMVPQPMTVVIREAIAPSSVQKIQNWMRLCYEAETGRAGYTTMYYKDIILKGLDGIGAIIEKWILHGAWIQSVAHGELTYETGNALVKDTLTLRFNRATLEF